MTPRTFVVGVRTLPSLVAYLERALADGKPLRVTVGAQPSKTREQNAYLHLAIRHLAEHTGVGETELKTHLKREYGPEESLRIGNTLAVIPKSLSRYSKEEAAAMIEHVHRIAAECGLLLEPAGGEW